MIHYSITTTHCQTKHLLAGSVCRSSITHMLARMAVKGIDAYAKIWLMLMLMLKYCERKTLFRG